MPYDLVVLFDQKGWKSSGCLEITELIVMTTELINIELICHDYTERCK